MFEKVKICKCSKMRNYVEEFYTNHIYEKNIRNELTITALLILILIVVLFTNMTGLVTKTSFITLGEGPELSITTQTTGEINVLT